MADPHSEQDALFKHLIARRNRQGRRFYKRFRQEVARRKQLDLTVKNLEDRLVTVLNFIDEFVILFQFSPQGRPIPQWQSLPTETFSGYSRTEMVQMGGVESLVYEADRRKAEEMLQAVAAGQTVRTEIRIVDKDQNIRWIRIRQVPVWDETHTKVTHFYAFTRDITRERFELDQQSRFLSNAIHELAHPISNLTLRIYLMRRQSGNIEENLDMLETMTVHLRQMVEHMRELSYIRNHQTLIQPKPMIVQRLLGDLIETHRAAATNRQLRLVLQAPQTSLDVFVDPHSMTRALGYLLMDAINTATGAHDVVLHVTEQTDHVPSLVEICIRYHGPHDPNSGEMFIPFHRSSEGGVVRTGMELAIALGLIELHGARVDFKSEPNGRREFRVRLLPA